MNNRIKHTLALLVMESTLKIGLGRSEARVFIETLSMGQELTNTFSLQLDHLDLKCCDDLRCKGSAALNYTETIMPMASMLETKESFNALFELFFRWGVGTGMASEYPGRTIMYSGMCDRTANKILQDIFTEPYTEHQFYYRKPELEEAVRFHYGDPVPLMRGERLVGYDGNLLIPLVSADYNNGSVFDKLFRFKPVKVDSGFSDVAKTDSEDVWTEYIVEGEQ